MLGNCSIGLPAMGIFQNVIFKTLRQTGKNTLYIQSTWKIWRHSETWFHRPHFSGSLPSFTVHLRSTIHMQSPRPTDRPRPMDSCNVAKRSKTNQPTSRPRPSFRNSDVHDRPRIINYSISTSYQIIDHSAAEGATGAISIFYGLETGPPCHE